MSEIATREADAELTTYQDAAVQRLAEWARSAQAASQIARSLVNTSFVPAQFKGKADEATAAILAGLEVGLSPMNALRAFDIIQGVAAPRALTLRAIVQAQGHEIVMVESTATRCRMKGRRRGESEWTSVAWTIDRARELGLVGKDQWKKQPQTMLVARATSELARLIASDAILGIGYSSEEVADGTQDATVSDDAEPQQPTGTRRMSRRSAAPAAPEPEPTAEPEPSGLDEFHPDTTSNPESPAEYAITRAQSTKLHAVFGDLDITNRDEKIAMASAFVGRQLSSSSDLTKDEAGRFIDYLEGLASDRQGGQQTLGGAE